MSWKEALKEYAAKNGQYVIPKKGSPEYDEVKAIQDKLRASPATQTTPVKKGKGVKEVFVKTIRAVNNRIDNNIPPVPEDVPLEPREMHAKKIVRRNGRVMRQNYNYAGPGTNVEQRLARNIQPIDGIDAAAKQHDIDYTLDFQKKMKRGQKVSKQEVQQADKRFVERVQSVLFHRVHLASVNWQNRRQQRLPKVLQDSPIRLVGSRHFVIQQWYRND